MLEDNRCVVHRGAAFHSPTCCASARVSLCCHSSKSTAGCDLPFTTVAFVRVDQDTSVRRRTLKEKKCTKAAAAALATTAARYRGTDHSKKPQLIAFPPSLSPPLSLFQSCIFSSSFDWRSIRHMINTGPRSRYPSASLRANPDQHRGSGANEPPVQRGLEVQCPPQSDRRRSGDCLGVRFS